jgi:hypothetical protein
MFTDDERHQIDRLADMLRDGSVTRDQLTASRDKAQRRLDGWEWMGEPMTDYGRGITEELRKRIAGYDLVLA